MGNDAPYVNPPVLNGRVADIHITTHGSDWYWALFAIFALSTLLVLGSGFTTHPTNRIFHHLVLPVFVIASLSTFSIASDLGFVPIAVEFHRSSSKTFGTFRQIWYVRYIDWFLTTPLLLSALLLSAAVPLPTVLVTSFLASTAIVAGLVGALVSSTYKWGYYAFAVFLALYVAYVVALGGRKHATALGTDISRIYNLGSLLVLILVPLYAIAWGVSEGGNVIAPDSELAFYGVLDLIAKVGFGAIILSGWRGIEADRVGLRLRDPEDPLPGQTGRSHRNGGKA